MRKRNLVLGLVVIVVLLGQFFLKPPAFANLIDKSFSKDVTGIVIEAKLRTHVEGRYMQEALKSSRPMAVQALLGDAARFPFSQSDVQSWAAKAINAESERMKGVQASSADPVSFQTYREGTDQDKIYVSMEATLFPANSIEPSLNHDVIVFLLKKRRVLLVNAGAKIGMTQRPREITFGPFLFPVDSDINIAERKFQKFIERHIVASVVVPY